MRRLSLLVLCGLLLFPLGCKKQEPREVKKRDPGRLPRPGGVPGKAPPPADLPAPGPSRRNDRGLQKPPSHLATAPAGDRPSGRSPFLQTRNGKEVAPEALNCGTAIACPCSSLLS
jgi:hypothetical protein